MSPRREAQIRAARLGSEARERAEDAEREAKRNLGKVPVLSERERRRVWNGYRGGIAAELGCDLTNRAKVGREWLRSIGQEPNWDLDLSKKGA